MERGTGMDLNKSNMKNLMLLIAFGCVFYLAVQNLSGVPAFIGALGNIFAPILLGLALTFIFNVMLRQVENQLFAPLNRRFRRRWPKARRAVALLVTLLIIFGLISLVLLIIIPDLVSTITNLTARIPGFFNRMQQSIQQFGKAHPLLGRYVKIVNIDWSSTSQMLVQYGQNFASILLGSTVAVTTRVFQGALAFVLGFVLSLNILAQKETLKRQATRVLHAYLPVHVSEWVIRLARLTDQAFSNFIAGQCTEACILGSLCFIGMSIFRFNYALLISVLVTFMALIPILGSFVSIVVGALLMLVVSPVRALWFVVFFVVLQQIEGNFIFPRVVGSRVGLPPLWMLVAVILGANAFGVVGMLVNVPLFSIFYVLLRDGVRRRLGPEPGPETRAEPAGPGGWENGWKNPFRRKK